jgi:hypothetical protein
LRERGATKKSELLEDIEDSWVELNGALDRLTEAQKTTIRDPQGWGVKDHLTHMTAWERSMVFFLQGKPRHEGLGVEEGLYLQRDYDEINAAIYEAGKDLTLNEAAAQFREAHAHLMSLVGPMTDEDLQKPYSHYLPDEIRDGDEPAALDMIYGNTADHFKEHLGWIRELVGQERLV